MCEVCEVCEVCEAELGGVWWRGVTGLVVRVAASKGFLRERVRVRVRVRVSLTLGSSCVLPLQRVS